MLAIIMWFLRVLPFRSVLATDKKPAPNIIPDMIPANEKIRTLVIASTFSDGVK